MQADKLRERVLAARKFPDNTCPASRHAQLIGEALVKRKPYPMLQEEPEHCGETLLAVVAALYELRTAHEKLIAIAEASEGLMADAMRWRFVRDPVLNAWEPQPPAWVELRGNEHIESDWLTGESLDAAIDAAMAGAVTAGEG